MNNFVHLHVHSEGSILDGSIRCNELISRIKQLNMPAVALTDHGCLHNTLNFYKECKKRGVKGLLGVEAYTTENPDDTEKKTRDNHHMILIAKNQQGYKDLLRLVSLSNMHNFYYKPRISIENLKECGENFVASTACLGGVCAKLLEYNENDNFKVHDPDGRAEKKFDLLRAIFGNNFFAEIIDTDDPRQEPYNRWLINLARKRNVPIIVTTDAHYLTKAHHKLHTLMMAMQMRQTVKEYLEADKMLYGPDFYIKSYEEIVPTLEKYDIPEAAENTLLVSEMCDPIEIELGVLHPPVFDLNKAPDLEEFLEWKKANSS